MIDISRYSKYGGIICRLLFPGSSSTSFIPHIQVDPCNVCNLRCISCSTSFEHNQNANKKMLLLPTLKAILDQAKPLIVTLSGNGEPTLNEDLPDLVSLCKNRRIKTVIITNGTRLVTPVGNALGDSGPDIIKISIDGPDRETYRRIRGEDCFDEIITGIQNINERINHNGLNIKLQFYVVVQSANFRMLHRFVELAHLHKVGSVYFRMLQLIHFPDDTKADLTSGIDIPGLITEFKRAELLANKLGIKTNLGSLIVEGQRLEVFYNYNNQLDNPYTRELCLMPWIQLFISVNGQLSPCCSLYQDENVILSNLEQNELGAFWVGQKMQALRNSFRELENYRIYKSCRNCAPVTYTKLFRFLSIMHISLKKFLADRWW